MDSLSRSAQLTTNTSIHNSVRWILIGLLLFEIAAVASLWTLGGPTTYSLVFLIAGAFATLLPLLIGIYLLCRNRFRFGLQSMMVTVTLVAIFIFVGYLPILEYGSARSTSAKLVNAKSRLNFGMFWLRDYYRGLNLEPTPQPGVLPDSQLFPWLKPFAGKSSLLPRDDSVLSVHLNSDEQVQILCDNAGRLKNLQYIRVGGGISPAALVRLGDTFAQLPNLDAVALIDVRPPENWYQSPANVRTLFLWAIGNLKEKKITAETASSILSFENLEVLSISGFLVDDTIVESIASAPSLQRLVLEGTAATRESVSKLNSKNPECLIHLQ